MKKEFYNLPPNLKRLLMGLMIILTLPAVSMGQVLTLVSPNGGETFVYGSTMTVEWENNGSPANLVVEFSEDGGAYWYQIYYIYESDTSTSITFQNTLPPTTEGKFRIAYLTNSSIQDESDSVFTILEPPVYIYSPAFGEVYYRNQEIQIYWYAYEPGNYDLSYSLDNGETWTGIVSNFSGYEYLWTAPDQTTEEALIRIAMTSDPSSYGLSPLFPIRDVPVISLTSPNGGETWNYGTDATVSWTGTGLNTYVYIDFSDDGGSTWYNIGSAYSQPEGGSAPVFVPYVSTGNALVKVYDPYIPVVSDVSDAPFSVVIPPVILQNPYPGSVFYNNSEIYISWMSDPSITLLNAELSTDNGQTFSLITEGLNASMGYGYVTLSGNPSESCILRLYNPDNPSQSGSVGTFTILAVPVLTLVSPSEGDIFDTEKPVTISWEYDIPSTSYLYIEFSTDNGANWTYIGYGTSEGLTGSFNWVTPVVNSDQCRIRLTDYYLNMVADTSGVFSVIDYPATPICMVSVDTVTNRNIVMWDKPSTDLIEQFIVYKESSQANVYEVMATVAYGDPAMVIDTNSNPTVKPYRYKLGFSDSNGVVFPASDFHQTIHLTINQGVNNSWNLLWTSYIGFEATSYIIHRRIGGGSYSQIATISSSFNSYTDVTAPAGDVYYMVEVVSPSGGCDPAGRSGEYSSTFSNVATNSFLSVNDNKELNFSVYPSPADDRIQVSFGSEISGNVKITLSDLLGQPVYQATIDRVGPGSLHVINTREFRNGIYVLQLVNEQVKTSRKIVIRH